MKTIIVTIFVLLLLGCSIHKVYIKTNPPDGKIYISNSLYSIWVLKADSTHENTMTIYESERNAYVKAKKYGLEDSEPIKVSDLLKKDEVEFKLKNNNLAFGESYILVSNVSDSEKENLAVITFESELEVIDKDALTKTFENYLIKSKRFNVIERNNLKNILNEQKLQLTGLTNPEDAVKVGQILNAKKILFGEIGKYEEKYVFGIRIVDVETSKVIYSNEENIDNLDDFADSIIETVNKITKHFLR
ncbi:MAG: CsgG/HfaB family protein [Candidatus Firestonebacteria bacterium]